MSSPEAAGLWLPEYGKSTIAEILPGIAAQLKVPGFGKDWLGLPARQRYVLLLVDGLGSSALGEFARHAPFLAELANQGRTITSGAPSTTATSLTCLGTGLPPGLHGIAGYTFWLPENQQVLSPLVWDTPIQPEQCQPNPTVFSALAAQGVATTSVSLGRFENSGLTRAALRGTQFVPATEEEAVESKIEMIIDAATQGERTVVYAYERELDHLGHVLGVQSPEWLAALADASSYASQLRAALPADVALIITGDHGMLNVPRQNQIIIEDEPILEREISVIAGEGRMRQFLLHDGRDPESVAQNWQDWFGDTAWVRTREAAIAEGWFGPVAPAMLGRFGEVIVAMRANYALMTRTLSREFNLVGMHGSLTPTEMEVPLLIA